jgi:periplasmic mercuric ion binding protein
MNRLQFIFGFFSFVLSTLFVACSPTTKVSDGRYHLTGKENIHTPALMDGNYKVAGNCETSKKRIENAALNVKGVKVAHWDEDQQVLRVTFFPDETDSLKIQKAIAAVGHDTEKFKADDAVYQKLPNCCKYTRLFIGN